MTQTTAQDAATRIARMRATVKFEAASLRAALRMSGILGSQVSVSMSRHPQSKKIHCLVIDPAVRAIATMILDDAAAFYMSSIQID